MVASKLNFAEVIRGRSKRQAEADEIRAEIDVHGELAQLKHHGHNSVIVRPRHRNDNIVDLIITDKGVEIFDVPENGITRIFQTLRTLRE